MKNRGFTFYLRVFMAACFIVLAGCMLYYRAWTQLSDLQTYLFSALLLIYGIFRLYRAFNYSDDVFQEK